MLINYNSMSIGSGSGLGSRCGSIKVVGADGKDAKSGGALGALGALTAGPAR